jgi:hypothetical protein
MQAIAERTRHLPDAKALRLVDWIRDNLCPDLPPFEQQARGAPAKWKDRRVLIFTENREGTKRYLKTIVPFGPAGGPRVRARPTGPIPLARSPPLRRASCRARPCAPSAPGLSLATTSTRNMPRGPALDQRRGRCLPPVATEVASCAPATPTIEMTLLAAKDLTRRRNQRVLDPARV